MIEIKKDRLSFEHLYGLIVKYQKKNLETYREPNAEEAKDDYFWIMNFLLTELSGVTVVQYAEKILTLENPQEHFKNQIMEAASNFDLVFLEMVIPSLLYRPDFLHLEKKEIFDILTKLLAPYHHRKEQGEQFSLGGLFEQLVEWLGNEEDMAHELLKEIFSMDKVSEDWYYSMMPAIFKLEGWMYRATSKKFEILKQGLECPLNDIRYIFREHIDKYIKKGWIDENLNWIREE